MKLMQERIIPQEQNETMEAINTESKEPPTNLMDALDRIVEGDLGQVLDALVAHDVAERIKVALAKKG